MRPAWVGLVAVLLGCRGPALDDGPLALIDDTGHRTVLAGPASRIVSLAPATTELLFALGAGELVAGRTQYCDYPAAAAAVPSVGDGMQPNVETIVAIDPDLVVAYRSEGNRGAVDRLRRLGIPTIELATDQMADLERTARTLGLATGRMAAADRLIDTVRASLEAVTVHRPDQPSIFVLSWSQPAITLGAGSFINEIIVRAGATNLFGDEDRPSFVVSLEAVADRNPDFVLITSGDDPLWASRPEWQAVEAVRGRRFLRVYGSEFNRPSPRMAAAIGQLAAAIDDAVR